MRWLRLTLLAIFLAPSFALAQTSDLDAAIDFYMPESWVFRTGWSPNVERYESQSPGTRLVTQLYRSWFGSQILVGVIAYDASVISDEDVWKRSVRFYTPYLGDMHNVTLGQSNDLVSVSGCMRSRHAEGGPAWGEPDGLPAGAAICQLFDSSTILFLVLAGSYSESRGEVGATIALQAVIDAPNIDWCYDDPELCRESAGDTVIPPQPTSCAERCEPLRGVSDQADVQNDGGSDPYMYVDEIDELYDYSRETQGCHPAYTSHCLPQVEDIDCGELAQEGIFNVVLADPYDDPYGLDIWDAVGDGIGCEGP